MLMYELPCPIDLGKYISKSVRHLKFLSVVRGSTRQALHHRRIARILGRSKALEVFHLKLRVGEVVKSLIVVFQEGAAGSEAVNIVGHGIVEQVEGSTRLDRLVE